MAPTASRRRGVRGPFAQVENLVAQLTRLPGIGQRTAQRLAFHLLQRPRRGGARARCALADVKERVRSCRECGNLTEEETCASASTRAATAR